MIETQIADAVERLRARHSLGKNEAMSIRSAMVQELGALETKWWRGTTNNRLNRVINQLHQCRKQFGTQRFKRKELIKEASIELKRLWESNPETAAHETSHRY